MNDILHHSTPKEQTLYFLQCFLLAPMPPFNRASMAIFKDLLFSFFIQDYKSFISFIFPNVVQLVV